MNGSGNVASKIRF